MFGYASCSMELLHYHKFKGMVGDLDMGRIARENIPAMLP